LKAFNTVTAASNRLAISITEGTIAMAASEKSTGKRTLWNGIIGYGSFVDIIEHWSINHKVGTPIDLTAEHRMHALLPSMVPLNSARSCTPEHVWKRRLASRTRVNDPSEDRR
jgi:hypothetical protein